MHTNLLRQLAALIEAQAQAQGLGFLPSPVPGVKLMRMDRHLPRAPTVYAPCIVLVAQGRKIGTFSGRRYVCDARQCMILTVPLPLHSETLGSAAHPFLGLAVAVTPAMVSDLVMRMDPRSSEPVSEDVISSVELTPELLSTAVRLVDSMQSAERARVLGPAITQEMVYMLLCGAGGAALRGWVVGNSRLARITEAVQRLQRDYAALHDVATLARDAGMSVSSFHAHFKATTGESPLQYLKLIRLHKARELMFNTGLSAQASAARVGYESASQFGREFKRLFGDSPGASAAKLRLQMAPAGQTRLRATLSFDASSED